MKFSCSRDCCLSAMSTESGALPDALDTWVSHGARPNSSGPCWAQANPFSETFQLFETMPCGPCGWWCVGGRGGGGTDAASIHVRSQERAKSNVSTRRAFAEAKAPGDCVWVLREVLHRCCGQDRTDSQLKRATVLTVFRVHRRRNGIASNNACMRASAPSRRVISLFRHADVRL